MRKYSFTIIGAVITALLSTLCCLPAFLFIFFGFSSALMTYFTSLEYLRVPMIVITLILFILGIRQLNKKTSCAKDKNAKFKQYFIAIFIFVFLALLLFYPEIIPMFME